MKSYNWWAKQKKRVQKKYTPVSIGLYLSPREVRLWYREWKQRRR